MILTRFNIVRWAGAALIVTLLLTVLYFATRPIVAAQAYAVAQCTDAAHANLGARATEAPSEPLMFVSCGGLID